VLEDPLYFDFVLGVLGQIPASVDNVLHMYRSSLKGTLVCLRLGFERVAYDHDIHPPGGNVRSDLKTTSICQKGPGKKQCGNGRKGRADSTGA